MAGLAGAAVGALIGMYLFASLFGLAFRKSEPSERAMRGAGVAVALALVVGWFGFESFTEWLMHGVLYVCAAAIVYLVKRRQYTKSWVDEAGDADELERTFN